MDISSTKMSSKGQIVIPSNMRDGIKAGDKFMIIRDNDNIILKKVDSLAEIFKEDLEFAKRTEEILELMENGHNSKMKFDDFIEEIKKW